MIAKSLHFPSYTAAREPRNPVSAKVLIVDDNDMQCELLSRIMHDAGFSSVRVATDGTSAWSMAQDWDPDLVFLDQNMPGMHGTEVCVLMRKEKRFADTVVIMQTALDDPESRAKAFEAGATDFISKPINAPEAVARARAHLERKFLKEELDADYERLQGELKEATLLQNILLPQEEALNAIRTSHGLDIAQYYHPSSELGGDHLAVKKLDNTRILLLTADVSGHGVTAALYTFVLHTVVEEYAQEDLSPGLFLEKINSKLYTLMSAGKFVTLFLGIIDTDAGTLTYAAAAAPSPILLSGDRATHLETRGFLLGTQPHSEYETHSIPFGKGDLLCLYSDAFLESPATDGSLMTQEDFASQLKAVRTQHAGTILKSAVSHFFNSHKDGVRDDLSLLVCKYEDA